MPTPPAVTTRYLGVQDLRVLVERIGLVPLLERLVATIAADYRRWLECDVAQLAVCGKKGRRAGGPFFLAGSKIAAGTAMTQIETEQVAE